jgi:hypothetical protein
MKADFESLRFNKIVCEKNLIVSRMHQIIEDFTSNYECDSLNVIYFSGHGFNFKGNDYIMAIDTIKSNSENYSISIQSIVEKYSGMHAYLILIIDACRTFDGEKQSFRGVNMPKDVMIAYSSQIGKESFGTGPRGLSPFTKAIHSNILKANLSINSLFQIVRQQLSNDKYVQMSCEVSTMTQDIALTYSFVSYDDKEIYNFVKDSNNGTVLEAAIKASELYNLGYLDIMYAFDKVTCQHLHEYGFPEFLTEDEYKTLDFEELTKMVNIKYDNYRFYYKDKEIRLGEIPLMPMSLDCKKPIDALKVRINVKAERYYGTGKIKIKIHSNLPSGFDLLVSFPNESTYSHTIQVTYPDTFFEVDENGIGLINDKFIIKISSVSILGKSNLIPILGKQGRNLDGKYVVYSEVNGKQIQFSGCIKLR